MAKKYADLPEYEELTKMLRTQFDFRTANKWLALLAKWQDLLTAADDESLLGSIYVPKMIQAVAAPGAASVEVGFQYENLLGNKPTEPLLGEIDVYDDNKCAQFSAKAELDGTLSAAAGTIAWPLSKSNSLKVEADATGLFKCPLDMISLGTVYVTCRHTSGGPAVNCASPNSVNAVTFTAAV